MGQTLTNGIYLPDEGERNSYPGLEVNWRTLDALILTVNGKAAPNVANTWTAAQTFTAGITGDLTGNVTGNVTGDLTGTAAKAIADEDGTSIKTGYGKLAGNQTWTGSNTFSSTITTKAINPDANFGYTLGNSTNAWYGVYTSDVYLIMPSFSYGTTPASDLRKTIFCTTGTQNPQRMSFNQNSSGTTYIDFNVQNKFTDGVLDPNGTIKSVNFQIGLRANGHSFIFTDGLWRNSLIPYQNDSSIPSLGSSSYQWSSVYAQTYYYNGTAWGLDKENQWLVKQIIKQDTIDITTNPPAEKIGKSLYFYDGSRFWAQYVPVWGTDGSFRMELGLSNYKTSGVQGYWVVANRISKDFTTFDFYTSHGNANLGTSTNKWKTLNGVNPGALSLPNSNAQDTSWIGDLTVKDGSDYNLKTFTLNGWVTINIPNTAGNLVVVNNGCGQIVTNEAKGTTGNNCSVTLPVVANVQISVLLVLQSGESVKNAIFAPCLGNV